jgi:transcriptional regulator with XRE-family HTH domain
MHRDRFTPNQVVAHNLRAARELRGLTQEQAAEQLEPFLGERWSVAVFSAAERSVAGKRIREFDADTIHAFARAFELPVGYFFLPPDANTAVGLDDAGRDAAGALEQIGLASLVPRERIDELSLELPANERKQILRLLAKDPGGVSERGELSRAIDRLKVDVNTLGALVGDKEER